VQLPIAAPLSPADRLGARRPYRSLTIIEGPAALPVLLSELRLHARVDHTDEDPLLVSYLNAASSYAEKRLGGSLIDTRWEMVLDAFPTSPVLRLCKPPFTPTPERQEIEVEYLDPTLKARRLVESVPVLTVGSGTFVAYRNQNPPVIAVNVAGVWPVTGTARGAVTVRWWAGYGASSEDVPVGIRHAILLLAATWYINREAIGGPAARVPYGVDELLTIHSKGVYQ
jgi:uncharacterized phiE125 gp8 family phage protein